MIKSLPKGVKVKGVGHRIVHGGQEFVKPTILTKDIIAKMEAITDLAPLHMPANLAGVASGMKLLPDLNHVAVFDTAFHSTMPRHVKTYAIDQEVARKHGIQRYGFHGTSHDYVAQGYFSMWQQSRNNKGITNKLCPQNVATTKGYQITTDGCKVPCKGRERLAPHHLPPGEWLLCHSCQTRLISGDLYGPDTTGRSSHGHSLGRSGSGYFLSHGCTCM